MNSPRSDRRPIALLAAASLTVMAGTVVSPALPAFRAAFANEAEIAALSRLLLTIVALAIAVFAPIAGLITDRFGRKPVLAGGLLLYGAAGSSGLWLESLHGILLGRALLGVAVAAVMTASTTLITDYYEGKARERVLGLQAAAMGAGGVVFLLSGGLLADLSWRVPFATYLLGWLVLPAIWRWLPEPTRARREPHAGSGDATERLPLGQVSLLYAVGGWGMALLYLVPTQLPFFLTGERFGASASAIGAALATLTVGGTLGSLAFSRLLPRLGRVGVMALIFLLVGPGFALVALADGWLPIYAGLLVAGFGLGQLMPGLSLWLARVSPPRLRGRVMGGLTTSLFLGQFLSPMMAEPVVASGGIGGPTGAFAVGALTATVFGLCCLLLALWGRHATRLDQPGLDQPGLDQPGLNHSSAGA